jgi:glutamine synthetase
MSQPLNIDIYNKFNAQFSELRTAVCVEYIWIGGGLGIDITSQFDLRSKTRVFHYPIKQLDDIPIWNFDGSSTGQASGDDSEICIKPVAIYCDPFRGGDHKMVLCECLTPTTLQPIGSNTRADALCIFEMYKSQKPWYGIEQEYVIMSSQTSGTSGHPYWSSGNTLQEKYYCGVGNTVGRRLADAHLAACLHAGVNISGINAEVMPSQWEFQVGPCEGISASDQLWISRYILNRIAEEFNVGISFHPKVSKYLNGSGCHVNFSTDAMRLEGGYDHILSAIENLRDNHNLHIANYGIDNEHRLTGTHETASINIFSYGIADRGASVRIPSQTALHKRGYFEDRRPASNIDPYIVTSMILNTIQEGSRHCIKPRIVGV